MKAVVDTLTQEKALRLWNLCEGLFAALEGMRNNVFDVILFVRPV